MTVDLRLVLKAHGNGSRFEVEAAVQNISGSTLLRHELHATDRRKSPRILSRIERRISRLSFW
jgi:hypothetical protein